MAKKSSDRYEEECEVTLKCKGLSERELHEIYQALADALPGHRQAFRNPFTHEFDANAIHQILVWVSGTTVAGYVSKKVFDKALDIVGEVVKRKLEGSNDGDHKKTVTIYGPDGKVAVKVIAEPEPKPRKWKR